MAVRSRADARLAGDGVVVEDDARRPRRRPRRPARRVIHDVADPVDRAADRWLRRHRMRSRVDQHVPHQPDVVHAPVHLDRVVVSIGDVVVVDVDRHRPPIPELARRIRRPVVRVRSVRHAIHLGVDAVVEIRDVVVGDDVAGAVETDRRIGGHDRREDLAVDAVELFPEGAVPAGQVPGIVPAEEDAIGDVEVAGSRVVGEDAQTDLVEPAALHRQAFRSGDELRARPDGDVGVPERDPFEVVVVGRLDVEQVEVAAAVDDHLAVARGLDRDRPLRRAVRSQVIRPLERRRRVDRRLVRVQLVAVGVRAGVHQDRVARFTRGRPPGAVSPAPQ